ncbi:morphogenic membrane protein MmpB [Wenjunlia tyrosinilytica]|nr:hypothetical protein [Wenjunlia tyrosinilytica]
MLWSDRQRDQEPPETRHAQAMLRRAGLLLAIAAVLLMALVVAR